MGKFIIKRFNIGDTVLTNDGWKGFISRKLIRFVKSKKGNKYGRRLSYVVEDGNGLLDYHYWMLFRTRNVLFEKVLDINWNAVINEYER